MNGENSEDIDKIINFISEAYSNVGENYLHPKSASGDINPQEENFSHELYTQMRKLQESNQETNHYKFLKDSTIIIDAERKKTGKKYEDCLRSKQPDLIIHTPGNNKNNLLVIEIKRIIELKKIKREYIIKDLEKLKCFIDKLDYKYGIWLIFGEISNENGNIWNPIKNKIKEKDSNDDNLKLSDYIRNQKIIILWCHDKECENISSFLVEGN